MKRRTAIVTGAAGFIGSHMVDVLLEEVYRVRGIDNLSAGRLENLSPLAVLARGYAVCWNADRTAIIRDADQVAPGERFRVTLQRGELRGQVVGREEDH